ncbi:MAG: precorrin-2 dehydrogenase/sirohydrochlorin ferrochelatase family protein, partial [bacterium]
MKYLPLHHNFAGRRCLVVGGGEVALKRARRVIGAGGRVDVIAPVIGDALAQLIAEHGGELATRDYADGDVENVADDDVGNVADDDSHNNDSRNRYALVVAATDQRAVNRRVAAEAARCGVPVNVADDAKLCDVVFPLAIDRDPITITVASGAASPTLTRLLGDRIDALIPSAYGELARLVGRFRRRAQTDIPDTAERIRFWENILQGVVAEQVLSGNVADAEALLEQALRAPRAAGGKVCLIRASPDDPNFLPLHAARLFPRA